ncbi:type I-G CRISPR-associated protein Csb2 [Zavarzinella formosa]|uniref:type I-G CRISPR-associated protein Csb2 n=1 Tax=Zavarzinella formosa TaxID=360055 RepID=UPI00030D16CB|nr:type I-U CRISPR-associated protein Csb2 [Zavarzinella formosa]
MFALTIEWLMGRAVVTSWNDREEPEWPPHPDRVFMALVAGFGESGEDPAERAALEWIERLGPPDLTIPELLSTRTPFTTYVPVNDDSSPVGKKGPFGSMGSIPIGRNRQPRHYPAIVPAGMSFQMSWDIDLPANLRAGVESLCAKATYLGHSATPVRIGIAEQELIPNLIPTDSQARHRMRVFGPGRLDYLLNRHRAGLRPQPSGWQGYAEPKAPSATSHKPPYDQAIITLRQTEGRRWSLESAPNLIEALRNALMSRHGPNPPEWLSGHEPNGAPSHANRPAAFPMAFVGREHADGHLLGIGIALPTEFTPQQSAELFALIQNNPTIEALDVEAGQGFVQLYFRDPGAGQAAGTCNLLLDERPDRERERTTLKAGTWTKSSQTWTSITPVMLPRYPKANRPEEVIIAEACVQAGYPAPCEVSFNRSAFLAGVPHVRSFAARAWPDNRPRRPIYHVQLTFPEPISGPVLIGAGRYTGFGICRPIDSKS